MKKKVKVFSLVVLMSTLFSCNSKTSDSTTTSTGSTDNTSMTIHSTTDSTSDTASQSTSESPAKYGLKLVVGVTEYDTYSKDVDLNSTSEDILRFKVTKNGETVTEEGISYEVSGDTDIVSAVNFEVKSKFNYATVVFSKAGSVTITFRLTSHSEVSSVSVSYTVTKGFLNKDVMRGNITEDNGVISIPSGVEATATVGHADTKWMLKATMKVPLYTTTQAFGLGSFIDEGNNACWAALRNKNESKNGTFEIYVRDFLTGWGSPKYDKAPCDEYTSLSFEVEDECVKADFVMIRNGVDYYFSIDGYHHKYTAKDTRATYPGFFSQQQSASVTNYSVTYEQSEVDNAIAAEWGENAKLDILKFKSKDASALTAGGSRSFEVTKAPAYATEEYSFTVNDDYKNYVTVENNTISVDKYAPEGTLEVTMTSASGKVSDKYSLSVVKEAQNTESEYLTATGGAYLSNDKNVVFPDSLYEIDGIGNEERYDTTATYGAVLKQEVYGSSFTVEFDVENYNGHNLENNNLLVSLGGRFNQYYFSFDDTNKTADVSVFTQSVKQNSTDSGTTIKGVQLTELTSTTHHIKIHSNDGNIEITVDNNLVSFGEYVPVINLSSYFMELPVRIATRNASCEVKNVTASKGDISSKNVYGHNSDYAYEENGKYVISMQTSNGWDYRDKLNLNASTFKELGKCKGAYTAKFKATLEGANSASKLCIRLGDHRDHEGEICFGENKIESGSFNGSSTIEIANNDTVYVTLFRRADGTGNVGVAKNENDEPTYIATEFTGVSDCGVWLWARNSKSETTKKVYIENITVVNA